MQLVWEYTVLKTSALIKVFYEDIQQGMKYIQHCRKHCVVSSIFNYAVSFKSEKEILF